MSGARSKTEDFSRKVAKAVLSPREDIDVAIGTGDHGEGGSEVEEADVYEVVDRYKQELEEIISNLKPQGRGVAGVASRKPVRRAWGDEGDDEAVGEEDLEVYRRALADDDGDGNDRVGVGVRALSDFGRDVESFRERVVGTKQQEPPTVQADLTDDFFFEMREEEGEGEGEDEGVDEGGRVEGEGRHDLRRSGDGGDMEGFGAAGSAELASRSYDRDGNGFAHSGRPVLRGESSHGDGGEDEPAGRHSHHRHHPSYVSVNAVELDAIQQELQALREWKREAEDSLARMHDQLEMSHREVYELSGRLGAMEADQDLMKRELGRLQGRLQGRGREEAEEVVGRPRGRKDGAGPTMAPRDAAPREPELHLRQYLEEAKQKAALAEQHAAEKKQKPPRQPSPAKERPGTAPAQRKPPKPKSKAAAAAARAAKHPATRAMAMAPFDRVPKSLEGALEAVHALRPFDGGMSAPSSQLQGPLDMGEMPMMARSEDSEATETTASEEEIEVELGRQWSLEHYLDREGRRPEEAAAAVDKAMAAGWERPRGKNNGGGETDAVAGRGERSKDYWLEEMLGAIDQEFHQLRSECSVSRESSRERKPAKKTSPAPAKRRKARAGKGDRAGGKKKRETFAESLGTWKQGLRAAAEQARPKSATPGGGAKKKQKAATKAKRPKTASRYMKTRS